MNIVIDPNRQRETKLRQVYQPKNVFSDATHLRLLRWIEGRERPVTGDTQLELAKAIHKRLPWAYSFLLHSMILLILACILLPKLRVEKINVLTGAVISEAVLTTVDTGREPETTPSMKAENTIPHSPIPAAGFSLFNTGDGDSNGNGFNPAILAGLHWLAKVQNTDGSWTFASNEFSLSALKRREDTNAATAMALLAFLGAGNVSDNRLQTTFDKGWQFLRQRQNPATGCFFDEKCPNTSYRFYTHALCTMVLCEQSARTKDEKLQQATQSAIDYCCRHQSMDGGGWRYLPDRYSPQSDVSVTGWVVLALKTGESAGLTVPPAVYVDISKFLDRMERNGQYRYREEEPDVRESMTAEALFCRILIGKERNINHSGISRWTAERRDVYYSFFAANVLFQIGGDDWAQWNTAMRTELVRQQDKDGGDAGSWSPRRPQRDAWGTQYGRLYTTCFSLYLLEVPQRYRRF